MDMPQEAPHAPSSDLLSMDLCINSLNEICCSGLQQLQYCLMPTVRGPFELYIQLTDVVVHQVYLPVAHHPAQRYRSDAITVNIAKPGQRGRHESVTELTTS